MISSGPTRTIASRCHTKSIAEIFLLSGTPNYRWRASTSARLPDTKLTSTAQLCRRRLWSHYGERWRAGLKFYERLSRREVSRHLALIHASHQLWLPQVVYRITMLYNNPGWILERPPFEPDTVAQIGARNQVRSWAITG